MKKVFILSLLLIIGLVFSQLLPNVIDDYSSYSHIIKVVTMVALAFIMIHVGYEFEIQKEKLREYGKDYLVAFSAATFPWIFVTLYFVYFVLNESPADWSVWEKSLLAARFAAPTSAGVLFSMLAAAGLSSTWMFKKTRILAIFDDLDTVILMIPLQMMMIGFKWQLLLVLFLMVILVWVAWKFLHKFNLSIKWHNVLIYGIIIAGFGELIYYSSKLIDELVPVHIEVLLPAFVLGCLISKDFNRAKSSRENIDILETKTEKKTSYIVSSVFMLLVGLSMPAVGGFSSDLETTIKADNSISESYVIDHETKQEISEPVSASNWDIIIFHVLVVTILSNLGKMYPAFVYKEQANWKERLSVAVAMFPRGEVGAGVLIISMSYGIGGMIVTVAMLSLALNLLLTGVFIAIVKKLLKI